MYLIKAEKKVFEPELFQIRTENGAIRYTAIFVPLLLEQILVNTLGTVNTAVLSNVSEGAVAAVGASNQLITMFNILTSMIATGAASVVNNYLGAGKKQKTKEASTAAIMFCCGIGGALGIVLTVFRYPVVSLLNLEGVIAKYAVIYFSIRCLGLIIPVATVIINTQMRCYGLAKTAVYSGIVSNAVNFVGTFLVVWMFQKEICRLLAAVGLVCVFAQFCGLAVSVAHFKMRRIPLGWPKSRESFFGVINKILRVGVPNGISGVGYTISQTMTTSFVALLGETALSGKVYFTTISSYCYMFSLAMGNAAATLVGRYSGAGEYDKAKQFCRQICYLTSGLNLFLSLLLLLFSRPILFMFTRQEEILGIAAQILLIDLIMEQSRARSHVYERALVAAGDSFFSMPFIIASGLMNGVGLGYLLSIILGLGLPGVWIGFTADETVRAIVTAYRWKTGKWSAKSKSIVEH